MNKRIKFTLAIAIGLFISQSVLQAQSNDQSFYKGLYVGLGFNPVLPTIRRTSAHQKGLGYGANLNLMYISKRNIGARIAYARWNSPKSDYETKSRVLKMEALYVLPSGIEFHLGASNKSGNDADGHGEITNGVYMGAGQIVDINLFFQLHFRLSAHHYFHFHQEKLLFDGNIGIIIPLVR